MVFSIYHTKAQIEYSGPQEIKIFADIVPYIGEVVISFSWLERRITWGIESMLGTTIDEADHMESFVQNFSARIRFFELVAKPIARDSNSVDELSAIVNSVTESNIFRNKLIHNSFTGLSFPPAETSEFAISAIKKRYNPKPEKTAYFISVHDMRKNAEANLQICNAIQRWVLAVRPNAENRVP